MGRSAHDVLAQLVGMQGMDLPVHGGRSLGYVYDSGLPEADAVGREAMARFSGANGLDVTVFPSLLVMENDLITRVGRMVHAPDGFAGSVTSGGTESILLAVLAARQSRPEVTSPEIVIPSTAHAAFRKAAHYFGLRAVAVDVDRRTWRADPAAMAAAMTGSTVLVVASTPSYAHGVIDPVAPIAAEAARRGIRCHVDACIGGFVLPFLPGIEPWDFAIEGVTSMSVDLHKYGYTPKGASVLLHRSAALRAGHLFATADWPGYTMLNTTMQSTKSGGPIAAAWAVTEFIGDDGYADLVAAARRATVRIARVVAEMPGLRLVTPPDTTLIAVTTDETCDVFTIADELAARGWFVQVQHRNGGHPATLHLSISASTARRTDELLAMLGEATCAAQAAGRVRLPAQIASAVTASSIDGFDDGVLASLLHVAGLVSPSGGITLPQRMAALNAVLDAAPQELRERLLLGVMDMLYRPRTVPN